MAIDIGNRFVVVRSTETAAQSGRISIRLVPSLAFGSGQHETTRSCLEELEHIPLNPRANVLDLGCGTGILSIAAAKMGVRSVTALDPASQAIEATASNSRLNKVEKIVLPVQGELGAIGKRQFSLIMANLYGDLLLDLSRDICVHLELRGFLLLSGIALENHYEVKTAFTEAGLYLLRNRVLDEYCTLVFTSNRARCSAI